MNTANERSPILAVAILLTVAVLGMVANLAWPYIYGSFLAPPWRRKMDQALVLHKKTGGYGKEMIEAVAMAEKDRSADPKEVGWMHYNLGNAMYESNNLEEAEAELKKAAEIGRRTKEEHLLCRSLMIYGWCEYKKGNNDFRYEPTIEPVLEAEKLIDKVADGNLQSHDEWMANTYRLLANLHMQRKEYKDADALFPLALQYLKKTNQDLVPTTTEYFFDQLRQGKTDRLVEIATSIPEPKPAPDSDSKSQSLISSLIECMDECDQIPASILPRNLTKMLADRKFDELESIADRLRTSKLERATGLWVLGTFYDGLEAYRTNAETWPKYLPALEQWIVSKPDTATPTVVKAAYLADQAWAERGGGWSSSVSEKGWKGFDKYIKEMKDVLDRCKAKGKCPLWYSQMQTVSLGQGWSLTKQERLTRETLKSWPDYEGTYFDMDYYLQPRWHGEGDQWVTWLTRQCDRLKGTEGDILYARAIAHLTWAYDNIFDDFKSLSWARYERGMKALNARFPNSHTMRINYFVLALKTGRKDVARHVFDNFNTDTEAGSLSPPALKRYLALYGETKPSKK